ncbi:recombinase family protein [Nocardia sp. NBC_01377]|uniref:recombinase family protein n=1 Tax=Nocardia sp. NBC_01377 TaxID=2903595 RepID=UPI0032510FA7
MGNFGERRHWQASTVRAILENPRYTGYAVFGRWSKHEELLDPDDVAAGHVVRFKRANQDRIVRSRRPAHPAIVSVETFTQAYLTRRRKAAGGHQGQARLERTRATTSSNRWYPLRGCIRCELCNRKMEATARASQIYYRCRVRTLVPGSPVLDTHPITVNLRQTALLGPLNQWIGTLFDPEHRAVTIAQLIDAQETVDHEQQRRAAKQRLADAETKLRRHQAAIEAGIEPAALVDAINSAQMDRTIARAELDTITTLQPIEISELERMIDGLGDISEVLSAGSPADQTALYQALQVEIRYNPERKRATVSVQGSVVNVCVRRGTRPLRTRPPATEAADVGLRSHPSTVRADTSTIRPSSSTSSTTSGLKPEKTTPTDTFTTHTDTSCRQNTLSDHRK